MYRAHAIFFYDFSLFPGMPCSFNCQSYGIIILKKLKEKTTQRKVAVCPTRRQTIGQIITLPPDTTIVTILLVFQQTCRGHQSQTMVSSNTVWTSAIFMTSIYRRGKGSAHLVRDVCMRCCMQEVMLEEMNVLSYPKCQGEEGGREEEEGEDEEVEEQKEEEEKQGRHACLFSPRVRDLKRLH